jgi:hypothetical protein
MTGRSAAAAMAERQHMKVSGGMLSSAILVRGYVAPQHVASSRSNAYSVHGTRGSGGRASGGRDVGSSFVMARAYGISIGKCAATTAAITRRDSEKSSLQTSHHSNSKLHFRTILIQ